MPEYPIYPCGDHAVTIELGDSIGADINRLVLAVFQHLRATGIKGFVDIIPAYHTITVVYDIALLKQQAPSVPAYITAGELLQRAVEQAPPISTNKIRTVEIPVCYDISLAPDIRSLAALHKLSVEDVISIHTAVTYRVYMIGFLPGFAYMGSVDRKIVTPRLARPRPVVPAGSVGIAGEQTGIYPFNSPGGWQLIGQTPVQMFAAGSEQPCYLQTGDEVKFFPVSPDEFKKLKRSWA